MKPARIACDRELFSVVVSNVKTKPVANKTGNHMMVIECPDCSADFAIDEVGDECPECGGNLTNGTISLLDYVIQCQQCKARIGIQNIDRDGHCPECGEYSGFPRQNTDQ